MLPMNFSNPPKGHKSSRLPPLSRGGKNNQMIDLTQPTKPNIPEQQDSPYFIQQNKQKQKNLTDGEINLPPDPNFFNLEDQEEISILDTRDTMEGLAIQLDEKNIEDKSTSYYIETSQQQSEKFEMQKEKKQQELVPENIEDKLFSIRNDINSMFSKLAQYFQGFVSGLTLMHAMLLYLQSDEQSSLVQYCEPSLRLNQMFYCFSLVSVIGALFSVYICWSYYYFFYNFLQKANKYNGVNQSRVRPIISSILFGISYILVMYNHQNASKFNRDNASMQTKFTDTYSSKYSNFKIVNIMIGVTSCLGWLAVINANEIEFKPKEQDEENEFAKKEE